MDKSMRLKKPQDFIASSGARALKSGDGHADAMVDPRIRNNRRDRLKQLRAFCQVALLGSITKAAKRVYSSQPAVSLQIGLLEEELGVALLVRRGPRIALTAAGERLYKRALPLVQGFDRLFDTFDEEFRGIAGPLRIGAGETASTYLLPRYIEVFAKRHAGIEISVTVGSGSECLWWLQGHEVDIVFAAMDVEPPELDFQLLVTSPYELITPEGHPLSRLAVAGPRDVGAHPQVGHMRQSYIRRFGEMYLRQHGVVPYVAVTVDGWETIKGYVAAGLGVAIVPALCLTERDRVCRVRYEGALPPRRYGRITRREPRALPLTVRRFIEVVDAATALSAGSAG